MMSTSASAMTPTAATVPARLASRARVAPTTPTTSSRFLARRRRRGGERFVVAAAAPRSKGDIERRPDDPPDTLPGFPATREAAQADIAEYAAFRSWSELRDAALDDRHNFPTTPTSKSYQQTVRRAFTILGIGMHSGEVEAVRVCPAHANEGRYFVRVPKGHIPEDSWKETTGGAFARDDISDEEAEDLVLEQLRSMLRHTTKAELEEEKRRAEELRRKRELPAQTPSDFPAVAGEKRVRASLDNVEEGLRLSMKLSLEGDDDHSVITTEHLLSALEAMGVDDARIEVEGNGEIPILDGSAYDYVYQIGRVGLVAAADPACGDGQTPRKSFKPSEVVMVTGDNEAFIMFTPGDCTKLTYGIDFTYKSRAIGKQWESWTPTEDGEYSDFLARARTFGTMKDVMAYFRAGVLRGGLENSALLANADQWWNPPMMLPNECARHKMLDLIGDLSLMAEPGMAGVPIGHIVAYKANHNMHAEFAKKLKASAAGATAESELWNVFPSREVMNFSPHGLDDDETYDLLGVRKGGPNSNSMKEDPPPLDWNATY